MKTYLFYIYFITLIITSCSVQASLYLEDWADSDSIEDYRVVTRLQNDPIVASAAKFDKPCYQVREQMAEDLKCLGMDGGALDRTRFSVPLLCFGTGKNKDNLCRLNVRPTFVKEGDETVDVKSRFDPDHNFNAFSDLPLYSLCRSQKSYSAIYFGHVANYFPPDAFLFQCYAKLLKSGGVFLYKSFAFLDGVDIPQILGKDTMPEVEELYKTIMSQNGFCNIRVIERDEWEGLKDGVGTVFGRSYLIYAEKDDTFTKEPEAPQESIQFEPLKRISKLLSKELRAKSRDVCESSSEDQGSLNTRSYSGESTPDLSEEEDSEEDLNKTIEIVLEDDSLIKIYEDSFSHEGGEDARVQSSAPSSVDEDNSVLKVFG